MQRSVGTFLVILGCAILVVEIPPVEHDTIPLWHSHGIHLTDIIGGLVVLAGIAALWTAPPR